MSVVTEDGRVIGQVTGIMETGANDVYIVRHGSGKEYLVPATRNHVVSISRDTGRIVVTAEAVLDE